MVEESKNLQKKNLLIFFLLFCINLFLNKVYEIKKHSFQEKLTIFFNI